MEQNKFMEILKRVKNRFREVEREIETLDRMCAQGNMPMAYSQALELEDRAERLVLLTRALPSFTGNPRVYADVEKIVESVIPVDVGFTTEEWFCVRLPFLLPRKEHGSKDYIRDRIYPALRDFFTDRPPVRFDRCVLIYRHVYDRERPTHRKRDHDNIEINVVTDAIALYVLANDGSDVCCHFYCSAEGSEERTEVYVVPREEFFAWYTAEKTMPDEGVKLYENRFQNAE